MLGAKQWCYDDPSLPRGANACERFAATLAWSYWPSADNSMRPAGPSDWSASMSPKSFRTTLSQMIGAPDRLDGPASQATVRPRRRPRLDHESAEEGYAETGIGDYVSTGIRALRPDAEN